MDSNYNECSSFQMNTYSIYRNNIYNLFEKLIENKIKNNNNQILKIKILDIACSHGLNSNIQVNEFINFIKSKINEKQDLKIQVYHSDLPENDFSKLFKLLYGDNEKSYIKLNQDNKTKINSYGIGNSFNNQIMPNESTDFIFSFFGFLWVPLNEQFYSFERSMISARFESRLPGTENCKDRLSLIFNHRLKELKKGGIFVCYFDILDQDELGPCGSWEIAFQNVKDILREMYYEGLLEKDEVSKMVLPIMLATQDEYEFSIQQVESKGLKLIEKSVKRIPWLETTMMGKSSLNTNHHLVDQSESNDHYISLVIDNLMSFCSGFIHSSFFGDMHRKDSMLNEFKSRLTTKYKESPKSFEFSIDLLYLSFEKQ